MNRPATYSTWVAVALAASLSAALPARAQVLTVRDFLRGATDDAAVRAQRKADAADIGHMSSAGLPLVRDVEFKIRNEGFDFGRQRYTVEFSPKGLGESAAARGMGGALADKQAQSLHALRSRALRERYQLVIDWTAARVLGGLHAEFAELEKERIRVLELRSASDAFDIGDIFRGENSLTRHLERRDEARAVEAASMQRIRALMSSAGVTALDTADLPGVKDIEAWLVRTEGDTRAGDTSNVHLLDRAADVEAARAQYELSLAENRRYLSSVEFGFDQGTRRSELDDRAANKEYDLKRAYLIEVGFRIPWLGSGNATTLRRRVELRNREAEYRREQEELLEEVREERAKIRALLERHHAVTAREAELDVPGRIRRYGALREADPLVLLTLRQAKLENALRREETRFEILGGYLEVMDRSGEMAARPLRNLFSRQGEGIE